MKRNIVTLTLVAGLALAFAGCSKDESKTIADDVKKAANTTGDAIAKTAEAAKAEGVKVVDAAKEQVKAATATATAKAQELIDKAKSLVSERKFSDASAALDKLAGLTLTADQQKSVDALKEQIKKAIAATKDGASAVGDLFKK
ncbi:MAG: hypothetical protein EXS35_01890 [Pedosphaera sp.]|nr:hypothetical protein [Pedosphaera sp.]